MCFHHGLKKTNTHTLIKQQSQCFYRDMHLFATRRHAHGLHRLAS
jgi:hypothetical protein